MNPELAAIEALAATAGIIKPKLTPKAVQQSFALPGKLSDRLGKWILQPTLRPFELPPPRDHAEVFEALGREYSADESEAIGGPHDAYEFALKVQECRSTLVQRYPIAFARDKLQDLPLPPSDDEAQDWLALVSVIEDEYRILDEIEMGTLTPEQVGIYRLLCPELYKALIETANEAIIELNAQQLALAEDVETTLEILMSTGRVPPITIEPPQEGKPPADASLKGDAAATQSERSEQA